jgi:hypothetical protein
MEDGYCENRGACDNCIKDAAYDRMFRQVNDMNRWDYDPDHDD